MTNTLQTMITQSPFLAILIVFWFGFVASVSSCTLIRLPIVFGYVSGLSYSKRHSFLLSLCVVAGLVVSYIAVGILLISFKNFAFNLVQMSRYTYLALGVLLLGAGLFYAGLIPGIQARAL